MKHERERMEVGLNLNFIHFRRSLLNQKLNYSDIKFLINKFVFNNNHNLNAIPYYSSPLPLT